MASTEGQKCGGQTKMCTGRQWRQRRKRRWRRSEPRTAFPWLSKFSSSLNSRLSFGAEEVQNRTKARDRAEEALQDDKKDPRARARRGGRPSGPQQIWTESDSRRILIRYGGVLQPQQQTLPTPVKACHFPKSPIRIRSSSRRSANLRAVESLGARR